MVIAATKYDAFKNADAELKKVMSRTLRFLAHTNAAALFYLGGLRGSAKGSATHADPDASSDPAADRAQLNQFRAYLNHLVFNGPVKFPARLNVETDHLKPVLCPIGSDRLQSIGVPRGGGGGGGESALQAGNRPGRRHARRFWLSVWASHSRFSGSTPPTKRTVFPSIPPTSDWSALGNRPDPTSTENERRSRVELIRWTVGRFARPWHRAWRDVFHQMFPEPPGTSTWAGGGFKAASGGAEGGGGGAQNLHRYPEPEVDAVRTQRRAELEQFRKQQAMLRASPAVSSAAAAMKAKAAAAKARQVPA